MSWLKRNLYFVIGSVVAVVLMVLAVLFSLGKTAANTNAYEEWNKQYAELKRLQELNPHPGDPNPRPGDTNAVNNIKNAQDQQAQLRQIVQRARSHFVRIPAIPDTPRVTGEDFTRQLRTALSQLRAQARSTSATLPTTNYNFTFESIVPKVTFTQRSLQSLAVQLGDIKAISEILFNANINALDGLRREKVCVEDDPQQAANDYFDQTSTTNNLAVITPYEASFRCFSTELAAVLAGFASSSNGFIVKTINIEPAPQVATESSPFPTPGPVYVPTPTQPVAPSPTSTADMYRRRYGIDLNRRRAEPAAAPTPAPVAPTAAPTAAPVKTGPQTVINEKPVKVTMVLLIVKSAGPPDAGGGGKPAGPPPARRPGRN